MSDFTVPARFAELSRTGHDIRGPAGVVIGALDELERSLGEGAGPHAALLGMVRRGARRLLRMADRYAVTAELARGVTPPLAPAELCALARPAIQGASAVHGRRDLEVALEGALGAGASCIDARVYAPWATTAIGDALLLVLRTARARVSAGCEVGADGGAILWVCGDGDPSTLTASWSAAQAPGDGSLDEGDLAARLVLGVMAAHGGEARLDLQDPGSPRLVLAWPAVAR